MSTSFTDGLLARFKEKKATTKETTTTTRQPTETAHHHATPKHHHTITIAAPVHVLYHAAHLIHPHDHINSKVHKESKTTVVPSPGGEKFLSELLYNPLDMNLDEQTVMAHTEWTAESPDHLANIDRSRRQAKTDYDAKGAMTHKEMHRDAEAEAKRIHKEERLGHLALGKHD
jgi:hypothetical protein